MKINHFYLHWCELSSLTLRDKYRFEVSENRVLRRIFGPNEEEVNGNSEYEGHQNSCYS
jgi:hypothetical protein